MTYRREGYNYDEKDSPLLIRSILKLHILRIEQGEEKKKK